MNESSLRYIRRVTLSVLGASVLLVGCEMSAGPDRAARHEGAAGDSADAAEFEGYVASVDTAGSSLTLTHMEDSVTVLVDDSTEWESADDGDDDHYLVGLDEVQTALDSGWTVEAEAEGTEQPDGSILARELEAEVEDDDHEDGNDAG